jgi:hypothetical protein
VVSSINITATVPDYYLVVVDPEESFFEEDAEVEVPEEDASDFFELSGIFEGETGDLELLSDCAPFLYESDR